jgi:hypothetical protein
MRRPAFRPPVRPGRHFVLAPLTAAGERVVLLRAEGG